MAPEQGHATAERRNFSVVIVLAVAYAATIGGHPWSAIQITTAAGVCAMLDLMREGKIPRRGFVRQEDVPLAEFLANRFGRHYA